MDHSLQQLLEERIKELEACSSCFATLFENSPVSIQLLSLEGKTLMVNPAWKKLWDISDDFVESYILKEYNILKDPILEAKGTLPYFHRAWAGEVVELPSVHYDPAEMGLQGRKRITKPLACPVKDKHGNIQEILLLHNDITEQHEMVENKNFLAEVAAILLESLDYNKTLEHIARSTFPYFTDGCLVDIIEDGVLKRLVTKHCDPKVEETFVKMQKLYPPQIGSPQPSGRVIHSGEPELLVNVDLNVIVKHCYNQEHADLINSTKLKSHLAVPLKIRGETIGALNLLRNSERRPFEEKDIPLALEISRYAALAIDNARLYRDAQKAITQREDFISIASHELKTPVTALLLQMEIIQSILLDQGELDRETLNRISSGASRQLTRLSDLIEDMLDLTRLSRRKLTNQVENKVNLRELTQQVISRFTEQLQSSNIKLTFNAHDKVLVDCDPVRMEQVITNLLSNAILYGQKKPVEIFLMATKGNAIFKIKDYGIGIDPSDHKRIFERFERGLPATDGKGLGLGLFISSQIIHEQGGELYVESKLGSGSTFIFELPLS
ncbi:MAG TPA: ATP-binding protein [Bacteriovoracaceae bacterium]|nr:ATP-binding protein [Bacteriovoracaceae bacterium]